MTNAISDYISDVIGRGNKGSDLLKALTAPTLTNAENVDVIDGKVVLRVPQGSTVIVHSATPDPEIDNLEEMGASLLENLVRDAQHVSARPVMMGNVVNTSDSDPETLREITKGYNATANKHGIAIANGENAILGDRVTTEANISGTMISVFSGYFPMFRGRLRGSHHNEERGLTYFGFVSDGKPIFINSDGVGTKTEIYERLQLFSLAFHDFAAMNLDDAVKFGAHAQVLSGVVEANQLFIDGNFDATPADLAHLGIPIITDVHNLDGRIAGYKQGVPAYNIDGSVVSTIDETFLQSPLRAKPGDYVIGIQSTPNARSNGITLRRELMVRAFGENWHELIKEDPQLAKLAEFLATPSTVLYPVMSELINTGAASNVFHFSGGAYDGKLAEPLAKQGLSAVLNIPEEHIPQAEKKFLELAGSSTKDAYRVWPMGFDGVVTTSRPDLAAGIIEGYGMRAVPLGHINSAPKRGGARITTLGKTFEYRHNVGD